MLEQIKEEAYQRIGTARYLLEWPNDVDCNEEKYWMQIQYLLDRLEIVDPYNERYFVIMDMANDLREELKYDR